MSLRVTVKSELRSITDVLLMPGYPSGYGGGLELIRSRENRCLRTHGFEKL